MIVSAMVEFFKHKVVSSIIVLTCTWSTVDRVNFAHEVSRCGMSATISCDPRILGLVDHNKLQGVLYAKQANDTLLENVQPNYFSSWYKWVIVGDDLPVHLNRVRFDADVVFMRASNYSEVTTPDHTYFEDVFIHPKAGAACYPWAVWTGGVGLQITHERERTLRRLDLKKHVLKIAVPIGHYSPSTYHGSFIEYLREEADPEIDSAIRCGYGSSSLLVETLKATEVVVQTKSWSSLNDNSSMLRLVECGYADLTGAILRILPDRIKILDYILPTWPFRVGFAYLAERASSSNMYVEPFSPGVWWTCLGICMVLALSQRVTSRKPEEKEGAYIGVLATWLQQDASAVPEGASGRWSFMVMSVSAMLVHAYYTSAIVSALMSSGVGGPGSLRELGDSKYAIASEDFDYMKYLFFDVETNWTDLEYLKKKKMTPKLYQDMKRGVELIREGQTAYHTEFNQIYPHLKTFSDDQLCKLQHIDTIPESRTWTTAAKRSQWTEIFRSKSAWLLETGLADRLVSRLKIKPPPCRASLLAERVKFGDVAPLLGLTVFGAVVAMVVLGFEVLFGKVKNRKPPAADVAVITEYLEYLE